MHDAGEKKSVSTEDEVDESNNNRFKESATYLMIWLRIDLYEETKFM